MQPLVQLPFIIIMQRLHPGMETKNPPILACLRRGLAGLLPQEYAKVGRSSTRLICDGL